MRIFPENPQRYCEYNKVYLNRKIFVWRRGTRLSPRTDFFSTPCRRGPCILRSCRNRRLQCNNPRLQASLRWGWIREDEIKSEGGLFLCSLPEGPLHITKLPESAASMLIRTPCKRACGVLINIEAQRCALSFVICGEDEIRTRDTRICV